MCRRVAWSTNLCSTGTRCFVFYTNFYSFFLEFVIFESGSVILFISKDAIFFRHCLRSITLSAANGVVIGRHSATSLFIQWTSLFMFIECQLMRAIDCVPTTCRSNFIHFVFGVVVLITVHTKLTCTFGTKVNLKSWKFVYERERERHLETNAISF